MSLKDRDSRIAMLVSSKNVTLDQKELKSCEEERLRYLKLALDHYGTVTAAYNPDTGAGTVALAAVKWSLYS